MVWLERWSSGYLLQELVAGAKMMFARMTLQNQVIRERAELAEMGEAQLRDIGITRQMALAEARRSDTDLPRARLAELETRIANKRCTCK